MVESDNNALQNFAQQRFKLFEDQDVEKGRFDVTFQFGDKQLYAHSFILWPISKVFENTLFGDLAEKGPIPIERHTYENFKEFITFLYLGHCKIFGENVMALVDLAEYYNIQLLKDQCDTFLTTNFLKIKNVLKIYESVKLYNLKKTMFKVTETIASDTEKILKSEDFLNAKKETILDIVKMDNLTSKEEELFQAVLNWASHKNGNDNEKIKKELVDILPFIRFPIMKLDFLHTFVVPKGFLFSSFEELSGILRDATIFAQNGPPPIERYSRYSNKFRGGIRLQFFDYKGNKASAVVNDPNLIEFLKNIAKSQEKGCLKEKLPIETVNIPEIKNRISIPVQNVSVYLVRSGGRMNIRYYQKHDPWNFFNKFEIIAPAFIEGETFFCDGNGTTFKIL